MRLLTILLSLLLAAGCAGNRIKPPDMVGAVDPAALASRLEQYNRSGTAFRALGEVKFKNAPTIAYGARAVSGRAVRMDAMAFPAAKLVFSASCPPGGACEVYFPDDFVVYRERGEGFGGWLGSIALGRVPLIGQAVWAGFDSTGAPALKFSDALGQWALIIFSAGGDYPVRALYGEAGSVPLLELAFSEFHREGDIIWPGVVVVGGSDDGDEFVLGIDRFERLEGVAGEAFTLRLPQGVRIIETTGSGTWKRLGMFWIPKF